MSKVCFGSIADIVSVSPLTLRTRLMEALALPSSQLILWIKGRLVDSKPPLKLKEISAIRIRLQLARRIRDLARLSDSGLSLPFRASCNRMRIAQISFSLSGGLES